MTPHTPRDTTEPTLLYTGAPPFGSVPAHRLDVNDEVSPSSAPGMSFSPTCAEYGMVRHIALGGGGHGDDEPMSAPAWMEMEEHGWEDRQRLDLCPKVGGFTRIACFGGVVGAIVVRAGWISWTWTHPRGRRRRWPRVSRSFRWVAPREPARRRSRRARPRARRIPHPTGGSRTWECARFVDGVGARGTRGRRRRPRECACRGKIRASDTRRDA